MKSFRARLIEMHLLLPLLGYQIFHPKLSLEQDWETTMSPNRERSPAQDAKP
jgi:hypothetical protein